MLLSESVPPGHGHNYGDIAVDAWANIAPGHGRDAAQLEAIGREVEEFGRRVQAEDHLPR